MGPWPTRIEPQTSSRNADARNQVLVIVNREKKERHEHRREKNANPNRRYRRIAISKRNQDRPVRCLPPNRSNTSDESLPAQSNVGFQLWKTNALCAPVCAV